MKISTQPMVITNPAQAAVKAANSDPATSNPVETYSASSSVGHISGSEGLQVAGAALAGAALCSAGGFAFSSLGGWGIPVAIAGGGVAGLVAGYGFTRGAHDGSVVGGMTFVGGAAGALAGGVGAAAGGLAAYAMGVSPVAAAGVTGALAAAGFATWLALAN